MKQLNYFFACAGAIATALITPPLMADSIVLVNKVNGHKYQRIDQNLTWFGARDYCLKNKWYLVTITSQAEQDFILTNFPVGKFGDWHSYWLGASNAQSQGNWEWVTTTEKFKYTNWASGEPALANGQYVYLNHTHGSGSTDQKWHVGDGNKTLPEYGPAFICEWGGKAYKDYVSSTAINDMNTNGFPEIAILYTENATGKITVQIKDASTSVDISTILFGTPNRSFPMSIAVLPDMNGNGIQEIGVLLINNITLKAAQEIRDASTGELIATIPF